MIIKTIIEEEFKYKFEQVFENLLEKAYARNKELTNKVQKSIKTLELEIDRHLYFCDFLPSKSEKRVYEEVKDLDLLKQVITNF
jgi:hypothetical protein